MAAASCLAVHRQHAVPPVWQGRQTRPQTLLSSGHQPPDRGAAAHTRPRHHSAHTSFARTGCTTAVRPSSQDRVQGSGFSVQASGTSIKESLARKRRNKGEKPARKMKRTANMTR